jgi:hypothetical protein
LPRPLSGIIARTVTRPQFGHYFQEHSSRKTVQRNKLVRVMALENRQFERYPASLKAVLLQDGPVVGQKTGDTGSLCVIGNLSSGGAFLVLVGAHMPLRNSRVTLAVNEKKLPCEIVYAREAGLHCKFHEIGATRVDPLAQLIANNSNVWHQSQSKAAEMAAADSFAGYARPLSYRLTDIYHEGFSAGSVQIDPRAQPLDAIVAAINPYPAGDERRHWTEGFQDAVYQKLKH